MHDLGHHLCIFRHALGRRHLARLHDIRNSIYAHLIFVRLAYDGIRRYNLMFPVKASKIQKGPTHDQLQI
ncbi:hypothetical protein U0070_027065 [Myodes glareolus]|uniref:Uncharacterized protein n=1 Tax=Myodes glareolus TaxID=447135 RepID=A0AAW0HIB7_MYOGA